MFKYLKNIFYGSNTLMKSGLVIVPIVNNVSIILASHIMSLTTTIGMYMAKEATKFSVQSLFKLGVVLLNCFF
jgi:hypothetical protein